MTSATRKDKGGCVKCGTCNTVCPVYLATGNEIHSPRGKQHLSTSLQEGKKSSHYAEIFSKCLLCGACLEVCPRTLDTPGLVIDIRSELPKISGISFLKYVSSKALVHPALLAGLTRAGATASSLLGELLPAESGLRLRLLGFEKGVIQLPPESFLAKVEKELKAAKNQQEEKTLPRVNYFTGCLANHLQPEIAESTQFLLSKTTGSKANAVLEQTCCGMAAMSAGRKEEALELAKKNIKAFEHDDLPILTSCASCYFQLKTYEELFADQPEWQARAERFTGRLQEFSTFFLKEFSEKPGVISGLSKSPGCKVFYHDPCHLRFKLHITREPRSLLRLFPGLDLLELNGGPQCCGQGGLFHLAHPDLGRQVQESLMRAYGELAENTVVTACSGCLMQWQLGLKTGKDDKLAMHLAVFIARLMQ